MKGEKEWCQVTETNKQWIVDKISSVFVGKDVGQLNWEECLRMWNMSGFVYIRKSSLKGMNFCVAMAMHVMSCDVHMNCHGHVQYIYHTE